MYLSIYFPISDFRDVRSGDVTCGPRWPVFFSGAKPFQKNLGVIRDRPLGGIRGWVQEGHICEIGRSIEIQPQRNTRVLKRFHFDGTFSGYFSVGVSGLLPRTIRSFDESDLREILASTLLRKVRSRHLREVATLGEYGEFAARVYSNGTTVANKQALKSDESLKWLQSARPIIVFEVPSDRLASGLKNDKYRSWRFMQNQVRMVSGSSDGEEFQEYPLVIIEKNSRSEDRFARQARMVLARLYCEFCLLQDSVHLLASKEATIIDASKSDYFCGRMVDALSRLNGSKRLTALKDPEFYRTFVRVFLDQFDMSKIDALAHGLEVHGARNNLRRSLLNSHLWMRIANEEQLELVLEKVMGNKYENKGVVGAMGDRATADNSTFSQNIGVQLSNEEMVQLVSELETLKSELMKDASTKSLAAAAAVSEAKEEAEASNSAGVVSALKQAGKWAFDVATKIGVAVAAAAIKKSAGL